MATPLASRRNLDFTLYEWLDIENLTARPAFADHSRETFDALLDLSEKIATDKYLPTLKPGDRQEPWQDEQGDVHVLPAIREALTASAQAGLFACGFPAELDGMAVPATVYWAAMGLLKAANVSAAGFMMLTVANARLIAAFGTPAQVDAFARPQIAGRWFGTMCLSEPQAGSSLADVTTRAEPDGADALGERYRLRGNKMWISAADHDASENIVHLVLAKVPGPDGRPIPGTRGISLFIVPKYLPGAEGTPGAQPSPGALGERNDIVVAGLNHKMGVPRHAELPAQPGRGPPHAGRQARCDRLPRRRRGPGPGADVPDDERGARGRGPGGRDAGRARLPARPRLRDRTPTGPPARGERPRRPAAGGVDPAPRRQAHAARRESVLRRRAGAGALRRPPDRRGAQRRGTPTPAPRPARCSRC